MKNKKSLILFVFLLIIILFTTNVFADTNDVVISPSEGWSDWFNTLTNNENTTEFMNTDKYYRLFGAGNTPNASYTAYIIFIDKEYYNTHDIKTYLSYENGLYYLNFSEPVLTAETWNGLNGIYRTLDYRSKSCCGFTSNSTNAEGNPLVEFGGTLPLVYRDSSLESFFLETPQTLKEIMEVEGVKKTIPITLVGLLKLLIPLLICLIGFWKAWRLLSKILHKA